MNNKLIVAYYLLLLVILGSWSNPEVLPALPLRLLYLVALILPLLIKRSKYAPYIILTYTVISASNYAVSYMPVDGLYLLVTFVVCILTIGRVNGTHSLKVPNAFWVLCWLSVFVDLLFSSDINNSYKWISVALVSTCLISKNKAANLHIVSLSFAVISFVLSIEFLFVGDQFVRDVHTIIGDLDRKGWADPNYFGAILGTGIVSSLIELIINRNLEKRVKFFYYVTILLTLYALFTTASRGAFIALTASSIIILFLSPLKKTKKIGGLIISMIVLLVMYNLHFLDLLLLRFESDGGDAGGRALIWVTRLKAFFGECNLFQWLFGVGRDKSLVLGTGQLLGSHNDFLAVLVMYGFIGFICLLSLLISPIIKSVNHKGIVIAAVVYIALCMFSIEPFTGGQWGCFYFYIYILMLSQVRYEEE